MKRFTFSLGLTTAVLALTAMPVLAGQRPNNDGGSPAADRGTAVDRPATSGSVGGGGIASAGDGGGSAIGGVGSSVSPSPSAGAASSPSFSSAERGAPAMAEPQHRRPGGGEGDHGGDRAVPRGSGSSGSSGTSRTGGTATTSTAGSNNNNAPDPSPSRAVPSWSRPRGDRPSNGTAVDRTTPPFRGGGGGGYYGRYYDPFFPYYGFGAGYGYGLGLGFGLYDPWFYDPWGYGGGFGYGAGYGGYTPYTSGAQSYGSSTEEEGAVRLKVKPRDAKVYVDGYFVGTVDSFDGAFQKLKIGAGHHRLEVKADGYEPAQFDVLVTPGETLTYQGDLKRQ